MTFALRAVRADISLPVVFFIATALLTHALYITHISLSPKSQPRSIPPTRPSALRTVGEPHAHLPQVVIFRRSPNTASTSLSAALLPALRSFGYHIIERPSSELATIVRARLARPHAGRIAILAKSDLRKDIHPHRSVVIIDSVRDGYHQITSFCRTVLAVPACDHQMAECLESARVKNITRFRWTGDTNEDTNTYVDLPLSAAHPGLSTTIMRTVFPNITLAVDVFRQRNASCSKVPHLMRVYEQNFRYYEVQVKRLRKRMLVLAGYPSKFHKSVPDSLSLVHALAAAERLERAKYSMRPPKLFNGDPPNIPARLPKQLKWTVGKDGLLVPLAV